MVDIWFPDKFQSLFWKETPEGRPIDYRIYYGGRGGGKSINMARALLVKGMAEPLRILCAREIQNSISDSVHRTIADEIHDLRLDSEYEIQKDRVIGRKVWESGRRTEFLFEGIRHNISRIRSFKGINVCWVEEAVNVTESSWRVLIPTIREENAEIWMSFNPELESDYTYKNFVLNPPPGAIVQEVNWRDNPWFNAKLTREKDALFARDMDSYLNVWEGHCRQQLEGSVYAEELRQATLQERLSTPVPYDPGVPVDAFFDLGWADATAIWFGQKVGFQYRIINYYQSTQKHIGHYLKYLQGLEYIYGTLWLPHDAKAKTVGSELSVEEQIRKQGFRCRIVPALKVADGINAARTIFPNCWFDPKLCAEGIQCLRHYRYEVDSNTKLFSKDPVHVQYSHGADAFRYLAVALKAPKTLRQEEASKRLGGAWAWTGDGDGFIDSVQVGLSWMRF